MYIDERRNQSFMPMCVIGWSISIGRLIRLLAFSNGRVRSEPGSLLDVIDQSQPFENTTSLTLIFTRFH